MWLTGITDVSAPVGKRGVRNPRHPDTVVSREQRADEGRGGRMRGSGKAPTTRRARRVVQRGTDNGAQEDSGGGRAGVGTDDDEQG